MNSEREKNEDETNNMAFSGGDAAIGPSCKCSHGLAKKKNSR